MLYLTHTHLICALFKFSWKFSFQVCFFGSIDLILEYPLKVLSIFNLKHLLLPSIMFAKLITSAISWWTKPKCTLLTCCAHPSDLCIASRHPASPALQQGWMHLHQAKGPKSRARCRSWCAAHPCLPTVSICAEAWCEQIQGKPNWLQI